jgi:hypothetical protein
MVLVGSDMAGARWTRDGQEANDDDDDDDDEEEAVEVHFLSLCGHPVACTFTLTLSLSLSLSLGVVGKIS